MINDTQRCSGRISGGNIWHPARCSRNGIVDREGKWYCGQHDPVAKQAKRERLDAKWRAKWQADRSLEERKRAIAAATTGIVDAARETYRLVRIEGYHCNAPVADLFDAVERLAAAEATGAREAPSETEDALSIGRAP